MIEITPVEPGRRRPPVRLLWLASAAALAVSAGGIGFVAGRHGAPNNRSAATATTPTTAAPTMSPADTAATATVATASGDDAGGGRSIVGSAQATTASAAPVPPGAGQYAPNAYPEEAGQLVAERTTAGGVTLRAHLRAYPGNGRAGFPAFPNWEPAAWCFPDGDLRIGISSPTVINVSGAPHYAELLDGLSVSTFSAGYVEGRPMFGVVAQVGADAVTVTLTAGESTDSTVPQNGVALLILDEPIAAEFTVTVEHADGSTSSAASADLTQSWQWTAYHESCDPPPPALPAPGEQPADPAAAEAAVRAAWTTFHDSSLDDATRLALVDDATGIAEAWQALGSGQYADAVQAATTPVKEIVFTSPTEAWVRYDVIDPITNFYDRFGQLHLTNSGTWTITRQTVCQDIALAPGYACTPPVDQLLPPSAATDPRYSPGPVPVDPGAEVITTSVG